MFQSFVITLREGFEAFLIVAISLAYLRKSGRGALAVAVYWGIAVAIGISVLAGYLLFSAANQEWLEGPLAMVAALSVSWLVVHMWRSGRHMKREIEGRLDGSTATLGAGAFAGVFLFIVLMVTREGMETALLLMQLHGTTNLLFGGVLGLLGAAFVASLWSRFGHRVPLTLFFQVTAIFLFVFVVQLFIAGIHEMAEQHYLPFSTSIHDATESWGPDSAFGHVLTYLMVLLPAAWLIVVGLFGGGKATPARIQKTALR
jgi:high-affinity iron transporter